MLVFVQSLDAGSIGDRKTYVARSRRNRTKQTARHLSKIGIVLVRNDHREPVGWKTKARRRWANGCWHGFLSSEIYSKQTK